MRATHYSRGRELVFAIDHGGDCLAPHVHVSAGLKADSADGRTSHVPATQVQFIAELVVEIMAPTLTRSRQPSLFDVPLLTFRRA
ncbi:hypothetical protein [Microbispora sp. NBC_01389]|uniref:hypothetical protein n=1 Tax=Microbispora sp. NBC_01389 TaxID=2903584 RepID=UPI0032566531